MTTIKMYNVQTLFGPVGPELLLIVALLVFLLGADRARQLANSVGESLGTAKKSRKEVEAEFEDVQNDMAEIKHDTEKEINTAIAETEEEINKTVVDAEEPTKE